MCQRPEQRSPKLWRHFPLMLQTFEKACRHNGLHRIVACRQKLFYCQKKRFRLVVVTAAETLHNKMRKFGYPWKCKKLSVVANPIVRSRNNSLTQSAISAAKQLAHSFKVDHSSFPIALVFQVVGS